MPLRHFNCTDSAMLMPMNASDVFLFNLDLKSPHTATNVNTSGNWSRG